MENNLTFIDYTLYKFRGHERIESVTSGEKSTSW